MKLASLGMGAFLALAVAACASAPPSSPSTPIPSASEAAMAPTATPMEEASTATPVPDESQAADLPRPTITINPRLHATNPKNVANRQLQKVKDFYTDEYGAVRVDRVAGTVAVVVTMVIIRRSWKKRH